MRASATSKSASPANYFASQAKADANKADNDSPFALLVASIAPKGAAKPAAGEASQFTGDGKPDEDQPDPAQNSQQDSPPAHPQAASVATPSVSPKPEKSGKSKDIETLETDRDGPEKDTLAALTLSLQQDVTPQPGPQILPQPVPPAAQPFAPEAGEEDETSVDAGGSAAKAQKGAKLAPLTSLPRDTAPSDLASPIADAEEKPKATNLPGDKPAAPALEQPKPAITAQDAVSEPAAEPISDPRSIPVANSVASTAAPPAVLDSADDDEAGDTPAVAPNSAVVTEAASNLAKTAPQAEPAGDAPAAKTNKGETQSAQSAHAKSRASANGVEHAAARSAAAKTTLTNPGQGEAPEKAIPKNRLIQAAADGVAKGSPERSEADGNDVPQAAPQLDLQNNEAAPKATPQPAPAAIDAVNGIAAPQAQSSPVASAPVNQHIQVTAHAAPDLPALAVEIAAKSQSGAKQFDIRLDPPELGRVEVRLSIDTTGKASAHLSADQPHTLSLLQKDAPILTRALREAGLDVSQNGLNFSLRQQGENFNGNANNNGRRGNARNFSLSASLSIDAPVGGAAYRGPANGRVDIRV